MRKSIRTITLLIPCLLLFAGSALAAGPDRDAAMAGLNALRVKHGLAPLSYSRKLEKAARRHAKDMARGGFFSHQGSDGSRIGDRVRAARYRWCAAAENIAKGQPSLAKVLTSWAQSLGHRRNMLHPEVTEFALVREEGSIWVMVLARPGC